MRKTLSVGENTWKRLAKRGKFGDSFEDLIIELLDIVEGRG